MKKLIILATLTALTSLSLFAQEQDFDCVKAILDLKDASYSHGVTTYNVQNKDYTTQLKQFIDSDLVKAEEKKIKDQKEKIEKQFLKVQNDCANDGKYRYTFFEKLEGDELSKWLSKLGTVQEFDQQLSQCKAEIQSLIDYAVEDGFSTRETKVRLEEGSINEMVVSQGMAGFSNLQTRFFIDMIKTSCRKAGVAHHKDVVSGGESTRVVGGSLIKEETTPSNGSGPVINNFTDQ